MLEEPHIVLHVALCHLHLMVIHLSLTTPQLSSWSGCMHLDIHLQRCHTYLCLPLLFSLLLLLLLLLLCSLPLSRPLLLLLLSRLLLLPLLPLVELM